jgi:hypothetical protein
MSFDLSTAKLTDSPKISGFDITSAKPLEEVVVAPKAKQREWADIPSETASNILPSALNVAKETVEALIHPIDTAQNVLSLGNAALQKVLPDSIRELMYKINPDTANNPNKLLAATSYYKHRFGDEEGFKEALATDPAGVMADMFSVLQPARALTKGKIPAGLEKTLDVASKFDPTAAPFTAVQSVANSKIPTAITGAMTGTGSDVMRNLYEAGLEGGDKLQVALKHMQEPEGTYKGLVTEAKNAIGNLARQRGLEYEQAMEKIRGNANPMDFTPIEQSMQDIFSKYNFENEPSGKKSAKMQDKIQKEIEYWKNKEPEKFHTPSGIDFLKRRIGEIGEGAEYGTTPKSIADEAYNAVKQNIVNQEPDYADVMQRYSDASDLLHELSGTFSLGKKSRTDTSVRKLQQALRNNANTNWGYRGELVDELEKAGAKDLRTKVAGQAASTWTPRGLQGLNTTGAITGALASANPYTLLSIPFQSPRLMGEASVKAGQLARPLKKGLNALKDIYEKSGADIDPRMLNSLMYQSQQSQEN